MTSPSSHAEVNWEHYFADTYLKTTLLGWAGRCDWTDEVGSPEWRWQLAKRIVELFCGVPGEEDEVYGGRVNLVYDALAYAQQVGSRETVDATNAARISRGE